LPEAIFQASFCSWAKRDPHRQRGQGRQPQRRRRHVKAAGRDWVGV